MVVVGEERVLLEHVSTNVCVCGLVFTCVLHLFIYGHVNYYEETVKDKNNSCLYRSKGQMQ